MDENQRKIQELNLQNLQEELADLKARWPAHSVKPDMIFKLDDLEEEIADLQKLLAE